MWSKRLFPGKVGGARNLYPILWFRCVDSPSTGHSKIRAIFVSRAVYVSVALDALVAKPVNGPGTSPVRRSERRQLLAARTLFR